MSFGLDEIENIEPAAYSFMFIPFSILKSIEIRFAEAKETTDFIEAWKNSLVHWNSSLCFQVWYILWLTFTVGLLMLMHEAWLMTDEVIFLQIH